MPTVSVANFEGEELLSPRIRSFMATNETVSLGYDTNGIKSNGSGTFISSACPLSDAELVDGLRPLTRNEHSPVVSLPDRMLNGSSGDLFMNNNVGFISGSCSPPPIYPSTSLSSGILSMRNHLGHPPYSALTSPCLNSKMNGQQTLNCAATECHSLQNSPLYSHYPLNGGLPSHLSRPLGGMSPNLVSTHNHNGLNGSRNGLFQESSPFPLSGNLRSFNNSSLTSGCPQRELFPNPSTNNSQSVFGSGLLMQDRLHYYALAQKHGFIVGAELERVKENSCRSTSQSYGRIAAHFRHRYGETEAKTKAAYLQIGVRVPSKDHVSEIVGKGGQKIKLIREETGALITTPGEHEEHVFIIEAPPEIAMRVAHHLTTRAQEITQSKLAAGERRRGSTSSQPPTIMDNGFNQSTNSVTGSTGMNCLLTPNGGPPHHPPPSTTLFSATNSPLHPSGVSVTNLVSSLRSSNGHLLSGHLSSLPASPCTLNGSVASVSQSVSTTNNSLFLSPTPTAGSRVLLARSRISVPQELVGKIIGTQGSIITTIQKDTGTEIKSPPKEAARGPNATSEFEISAYQGLGLTSNQAAECRVQQAKQLIGHLVMRQLERRASEDLDEPMGTSSSLSNESDPRTSILIGRSTSLLVNNNGSNGNPTNGTNMSAAGWMWPDVVQMDSQEAREVLDRILAESKNKTRRAKELAAASPSNAGPSPNGLHPHPGSMLNLSNSAAVLASNPELQQQQSFHMLASGLFEQNDLLDSNGGGANGDVNGGHDSIVHQMIERHHAAASIGLYSPQSHQLGNRTSHHPMLDEIQSNGVRTVSAYNNGNNTPSDSTNLLSPYNRNLNNNNNNNNNNHNNTNPAWNSLSSLQQQQQLETEIPHTLSSLFTSSPPPHMKAPPPPPSSHSNSEDTLRKTQLPGSINNFNLGHHHHHPLSPFNGSGFCSGGDVSPTVLQQHHYRSSSNQIIPDHASLLTRRHSDWVVSSSSLLTDFVTSNNNCEKSGISTNCQLFTDQSVTDPNRSPFTNSSTTAGFDFIKALDQLYLTSNGNPSPSDSGFLPSNGSSNSTGTSSHSTSTGSNPHCPPGFERHQDHNTLLMGTEHLFPVPTTGHPDDPTDEGLVARSGAIVDPWSNTDQSTSNALFLQLNGRASSKNSLFQSLFTNSSDATLPFVETTVRDSQRARLNAIWSQLEGDDNVDDPVVIGSSEILKSFNSPQNDSELDGKPVEQVEIDGGSSAAAELDAGSPTILSTSNGGRCGTIGEGRRRQPLGRSAVPSEVESPLSSSGIVSVPEVA